MSTSPASIFRRYSWRTRIPAFTPSSRPRRQCPPRSGSGGSPRTPASKPLAYSETASVRSSAVVEPSTVGVVTPSLAPSFHSTPRSSVVCIPAWPASRWQRLPRSEAVQRDFADCLAWSFSGQLTPPAARHPYNLQLLEVTQSPHSLPPIVVPPVNFVQPQVSRVGVRARMPPAETCQRGVAILAPRVPRHVRVLLRLRGHAHHGLLLDRVAHVGER